MKRKALAQHLVTSHGAPKSIRKASKKVLAWSHDNVTPTIVHSHEAAPQPQKAQV